MNINESVSVASTLYMRGATLSNNNMVSSQVKEAEQAELTSSYNVTLSNEGLNRSRAQFEAQQTRDERAFLRRLDQEEAAKSRELESEKKQFDRQQTSEKSRFEAEQRIEQIRFDQQQRFF